MSEPKQKQHSNLKTPCLNSCQISGHLTRDVELKYIPSGTAVSNFSIANTKRYKTKSGEFAEKTIYVDCVAWGALGEYIGQSLSKGQPVIAHGELIQETWEDKATGKNRSKIVLQVFKVDSLVWQHDGASTAQRTSGGGQPQPAGQPKPRVIEEPLPDDDIPF